MALITVGHKYHEKERFYTSNGLYYSNNYKIIFFAEYLISVAKNTQLRNSWKHYISEYLSSARNT